MISGAAYKIQYIHICRFNFDALAQVNAYNPTKELINYRGPGGNRTHVITNQNSTKGKVICHNWYLKRHIFIYHSKISLGLKSLIWLGSWFRGWDPPMGLLPDAQNCGLRMRRVCRERFPRHRLQRKPPICDLGMHHGTCVTLVSWCMSGSLTRGGGESVPGIPEACATRNFTYLVRGPLKSHDRHIFFSLVVDPPTPFRLHGLFACMDFPSRRKNSAGKPILCKFCVYLPSRMRGTCVSVSSVLPSMHATPGDDAW